MGMIETFRSVARFDRLSLDPTTRRLKKCASVDDYRRVARRRLPRGVFDYIDGGAEDEHTMARNTADHADYEFVPRILRDVSSIDTSATLFGERVSMPLICSPTGFTRIAHSHGELAVARAAERAGIPFSLSTMGTRSVEEVATVSSGSKWFQVYAWRDRAMIADLLRRAAQVGYTVAWLTADAPVLGRRERDVRRGMTLPPKLGPGTLIDGLVHPAWTLDFLRNDPITFANVIEYDTEDGTSAVSLAEHMHRQFDDALSWDDVEWLRSAWDGPIILKGVQSVADAKQAVAVGVEGIGLSNHGGRQLDHAPSPISLVEPVRQEIGDQATVICDGGARRGSDVVKAVALGADAVSVGRPYLYALGAAGERGVDQLLEFYRDGIERTMALTGRTSIAEIDRSLVTLR